MKDLERKQGKTLKEIFQIPITTYVRFTETGT